MDQVRGRGGAVEPRTTSSGLKPSFSTSPPWICEINSRAACSAISSVRWREVVSGFVAARTGSKPDDLLPRLVGHTTLAAALAAYEQWLAEPGTSLADLLDTAMRWLAGEDRQQG